VHERCDNLTSVRIFVVIFVVVNCVITFNVRLDFLRNVIIGIFKLLLLLLLLLFNGSVVRRTRPLKPYCYDVSTTYENNSVTLRRDYILFRRTPPVTPNRHDLKNRTMLFSTAYRFHRITKMSVSPPNYLPVRPTGRSFSRTRCLGRTRPFADGFNICPLRLISSTWINNRIFFFSQSSTVRRR